MAVSAKMGIFAHEDAHFPRGGLLGSLLYCLFIYILGKKPKKPNNLRKFFSSFCAKNPFAGKWASSCAKEAILSASRERKDLTKMQHPQKRQNMDWSLL